MFDLSAALVRRAARRLNGRLEVLGAEGGWSAGKGEPVIRVDVHDARAFKALARRGSVGLAESYADGWWDTEDLTGLIRLLVSNLAGPLRGLDRVGRAVAGPLSAARRIAAPSKGEDRQNVRAHYDLPPELFTAMLDETMTYSSGVFVTPESTLASAQLEKFERICTKLELGPDDHLVEIGTGWGGFAIHAASTRGCRVTTTTVSAAQEHEARARVKAAGVDDRVEVLGADYRDLTGTFDKLVSIEMIEAVDWRRHDAYFATCDRLLKPEGLMLLQAIVIADTSYERAKHHEDFIRKMIFPGGCLPSITAIARSLTRATALRIFDLEDIGRHYAPTLRCWHENLDARWDEVARAGLDERFHRLWALYLCYCEAAFLERHISDVQVLIAGPSYRPALGLRA